MAPGGRGQVLVVVVDICNNKYIAIKHLLLFLSHQETTPKPMDSCRKEDKRSCECEDYPTMPRLRKW